MSLPQFIQQHRKRVEQLTRLLYEEREQLSTGTLNGAQLAEIAERKQDSLRTIDEFEQQRRQALRRLGYEDSRAGDEQAAHDADCLGLWRDLIALTGEAERLNRANGSIISIRSGSNQKLLNALQEAAGKGLYGPDGRARTHNGKVSSTA